MEPNPAATVPRDMTLADLPAIVELHKVCFSGYFLTGLGDGVVRRFYQHAIDDPKSFACVLEVTSTTTLVGLAVGTLDPAFHSQLMRRNLSPFVYSVLRGIITRPEVRKGVAHRLGFVKRLFRAHADRGLADAGIPPPAAGPEARFLDVAVHPNWRGGGHAERLVDFFAARIFAAGAGRLGGSVRPENLASLILYKRLNWNVEKTTPRRVDVWIDRERLQAGR